MESSVPGFVRLAAHPLRWRLLAALAGSDHRVRELTGLVGEPQNLVSYHLRLLRDGGLVTSRRSSFDGRDSYYHLDLDRCAEALAATGAALHPALLPAPLPHALPARDGHPPAPRRQRPRVLFACTGNSARSPIAEVLLRHHAEGRVDVTSAGSAPKEHVSLEAVRVLRERYGIDLADRSPRHLDGVAHRRFDYVISLCDKVREVFPEFPGRPRMVHWSIPDPAAAADAGDGSPFQHAATDIDTRIRHLLATFSVNTEVKP